VSDRWDRHFLDLARCCAAMSKDPSTRVGAHIVGPDREVRSTSFKGFPRGVADAVDRLGVREATLRLMVHGEVNALLYKFKSTKKNPAPWWTTLDERWRASAVLAELKNNDLTFRWDEVDPLRRGRANAVGPRRGVEREDHAAGFLGWNSAARVKSCNDIFAGYGTSSTWKR
jgi:hypothetical protein